MREKRLKTQWLTKVSRQLENAELLFNYNALKLFLEVLPNKSFTPPSLYVIYLFGIKEKRLIFLND